MPQFIKTNQKQFEEVINVIKESINISRAELVQDRLSQNKHRFSLAPNRDTLRMIRSKSQNRSLFIFTL